MQHFHKVKGAAALMGLSALFISMTAGAASTASTEFTATIAYEGACDITAPANVSFNGGDAVLPSLIEAGDAVAKKQFDLTLANCQGLGLTPKITLTGTSNTDTGTALFADAASTSTGYGILLATVGDDNFKANTNLAANKTIVASDDWDATGTSLTALNGTIPMSATISCGDCDAEGRLGGDLVANVTFNFLYE